MRTSSEERLEELLGLRARAAQAGDAQKIEAPDASSRRPSARSARRRSEASSPAARVPARQRRGSSRQAEGSIARARLLWWEPRSRRKRESSPPFREKKVSYPCLTDLPFHGFSGGHLEFERHERSILYQEVSSPATCTQLIEGSSHGQSQPAGVRGFLIFF